jgi:hypothetical protein
MPAGLYFVLNILPLLLPHTSLNTRLQRRNLFSPFDYVTTGFDCSLCTVPIYFCRPGSSVGIATDYGLDGPGIESRWGGGDFPPVQTGPGAHPAPWSMGTWSFPGGKCGRGVLLTTAPF